MTCSVRCCTNRNRQPSENCIGWLQLKRAVIRGGLFRPGLALTAEHFPGGATGIRVRVRWVALFLRTVGKWPLRVGSTIMLKVSILLPKDLCSEAGIGLIGQEFTKTAYALEGIRVKLRETERWTRNTRTTRITRIKNDS
jgi:hypothetical protein